MIRTSFILPAYKRRFLKESIDSILAQTCREFELVIVDDKSPEGLYEVIKEYPWEPSFEALPDGGKRWIVDGVPVRYYQNAENIGGKNLVVAWTHAMEYATGQWCVLASDDDIYMPEYLEEMIKWSDKYPQCNLFHCRPGLIDGRGKLIALGSGRIEYESCLHLIYSRCVLRAQQTMPDFMFRKSTWESIGGFVTTASAMHSDDATWIALSKECGCVCSPKVLFLWRDSGVNVSMRKDNVVEKLTATIQFRKWLSEFISNMEPDSAEARILLPLIARDIGRVLENHMRGDMARAPFVSWLSAFQKVKVDRRTKLKFLYDRVFKAFNVGRLILNLTRHS